MSESATLTDRAESAREDLSAESRAQLLDPAIWKAPLETYARSTSLAVALADTEGHLQGEVINPQCLWSMLHAHQPAQRGGCPFSLAPAGHSTCVADALSQGRSILTRDRTGLTHITVPLVLDSQPLGALVAGQVFNKYPEERVLERTARAFGIPLATLWQKARLEHPITEAILRVYADLLATLGQTLLQTHYDRLKEAARVAELTNLSAQLRQRGHELGEANRRKDEFLAMLAHELRNPLAPIRNATQVMLLVGRDNTNLRWAGEVVERQVQHLSRLVDDLLDVSRVTSGKIRLRKEPTDLAAVVGRAVESIRPTVEARRQELSVELPPERLMLEADPVRLTQVLGNLLNNATKYTPEQGRIWLTVEQEHGTVVVHLRDTGTGIAADMLPHVFDLFSQADRSLAHSQGGLGIGLTLVKSLVEQHGGQVEAQSGGLDQGSEFIVRLPLLSNGQAHEGGHAEQAVPSTASRPRRILVVDDNRDSTETLAVLLKMAGHELETAYDGPAAIETAAACAPEIVLLDIGLPGMSGYEVARKLRECPATVDALLVALTGYGQEEDRRRAYAAGFNYHITKPVNLDLIQRLLASLEAKDTDLASAQ